MLVAKDIEIFVKSTLEKLRSESALEGEIGRDALLELMRIKWLDEKRYCREYRMTREKLRDWTRWKINKKEI